MQLLADFLAHTMHRVAATGTDLLFFGQVVLDALAGKIRWQRLATSLAASRLRRFRQTRVRQVEFARVILRILGCGLLGFVEDTILKLLAARCEALVLRKPELFLEMANSLTQLAVAGLELTNVSLRGWRQSGEFAFVHATHSSESERTMGLRKFVTAVDDVAQQCSQHQLV